MLAVNRVQVQNPRVDAVTNPYTPNAGATPEALIGRDELLDSFDILLRRLERGRAEQSMILTGLRGVGKTVLLGEFARLALAAKWEVVELEAMKHDDKRFRQVLFSQLRSALLRISPRARWNDRARRAAGVLSSFGLTASTDGSVAVTWDIEPLEGAGDHGELALDLTDVLVSLGELAADHGHGFVLLVDEVQFLGERQLEAVIQAIHRTVQLRLPITFVGAGLPQIAELAGDAKSYAERLFRFPEVGSLERSEADLAFSSPALAEGVGWEADALDAAYALTQGYPYFIQELGYQVWSVAQASPITAADVAVAREAYESKLDGSFFRVRLDRTTPLQTAYLRAMAELGPEPQKASEVAKLMGRESTQLGPTRAELIDMGLLFTPVHGYAAFTVPDFDRFMLRAVPELVVPPPRHRKKDSPSDE
nr:ATP-binding protein [Agromyces seonyuensis]